MSSEPRFTSARLTEREDDYARLLYTALPDTDGAQGIGQGSLFLVDMLRGPTAKSRQLMDSVYEVPAGKAGVGIFSFVTQDEPLVHMLRLADIVKDGIAVRQLSDSRTTEDASGEMLVRVTFPWLESSLLSGYVQRDSTTVSLVGSVRGDATVNFEDALGVGSVPVLLRKKFRSGVPQTDISGGKPDTLPPSSIDILFQDAVMARLDFSDEKLSVNFQTERARMQLAAFYATRIVCTIATLRVMHAAAAAYASALVASPNTVGIEYYFANSFGEASVAAKIESPNSIQIRKSVVSANSPAPGKPLSSAAAEFQQNSALRVASLAVGETFIDEIRRSATLSVNTVTPLRRMQQARFVTRENELLLGIELDSWRTKMASALDIDDNSQTALLRGSREVDNANVASKALRVAVDSYPQIDDAPDRFAEDIYAALRKSFDREFAKRVRGDTRRTVDARLDAVVDRVPAAAAVKAAIALFDADGETSARQLATFYLLSLADPAKTDFVDVQGGERLAIQLRDVRRKTDALAAFKVTIDAIRTDVEDERLYRESLRGSADRASLRERVLRSLDDVADKLASQLLSVDGVARALSQQLRRRIFVGTLPKRHPDKEMQVDPNSVIEAIDGEVFNDTKRIAEAAFDVVPSNAADARLKLQPTAITSDPLRIVLARLDGLIAKIENAAFDAAIIEDDSLVLSPESSRSRFGALLASLRSARVFGRALEQLYQTGEAPDISDASDLLAEDEIDLIKQQQKIDATIVAALDKQLTSVVENAKKTLTGDLAQLTTETQEVLSGVRATLSSTAFSDRAQRQINGLRLRVQREAVIKANSVKESPDDQLTRFVEAMKLLHAAGYFLQIEKELAVRRGDDEDQLMSIAESLRAAERVVARLTAIAINAVLVVRNDADPLDEAFLEYRAALREVIDSDGKDAFVPIVAQSVLRRFFENENSEPIKARLQNMATFAELQTVYFQVITARPLPQSAPQISQDFSLSAASRDRIRTRMLNAVAGLVGLVDGGDAGSDQNELSIDAKEIKSLAEDAVVFDVNNTDDRGRVAQIERVARKARRYFQLAADLAPITYKETIEEQFEVIKLVEQVAISLLREFAKIEFEPTPEALLTIEWDVSSVATIPTDELDGLLGDAQSQIPHRRLTLLGAGSNIGLFMPEQEFRERVDTLEGAMKEEKGMAKLRQLLSAALDDTDGSTDVIQLSRLVDIERLLDAGRSLLDSAARIKALIGQFAEINASNRSEQVALAVQLERVRGDLSTWLLRVEELSSRRGLANWVAVENWEKIARAFNLNVARILGSLPPAQRAEVDEAVLKSRSIRLAQLKVDTAKVAADLTKQLRDIETAAKRAADSDKTGAAIERKLEQLKRVVQRLTEDKGNGTSIDETIAALEDVDEQLREKQPLIESLSATAKDTDRDLKSAQKTLRDAEKFSEGLGAKAAKALDELRRAANALIDDKEAAQNLRLIEQAAAEIEVRRKRIDSQVSLLDTTSKNLRSVINKFDADSERLRRAITDDEAATRDLGRKVQEQEANAQRVVDDSTAVKLRAEEALSLIHI